MKFLLSTNSPDRKHTENIQKTYRKHTENIVDEINTALYNRDIDHLTDLPVPVLKIMDFFLEIYPVK